MEKKLSPQDRLVVNANESLSFRSMLANQNGTEKNIVLLANYGGIGDIICMEPAARFAVETFTDCKISIVTYYPEFFGHLLKNERCVRIFDANIEQPAWENYLVIDLNAQEGSVKADFLSQMQCHCVDFASLCGFRMQLPVAYREVRLDPTMDDFVDAQIFEKHAVVVHPGKHWQSKTFPKQWWDEVLAEIITRGCKPVLIGANADDNRSTVDVNTYGCIDKRNQLTLMQTVALLHMSSVVLTNDSAPLHMAATGPAHIGFIATVKHPDLLMHWRQGKFGHQMKNFGLGGAWDLFNSCPNKKDPIIVENVGDNLAKWLPDPNEFAGWACEIALGS